MSLETAIGPMASAKEHGDFAITCREPGEQLLLKKDGTASWPDGMSVEDVSRNAAEVIERELWRSDVSEAKRAIILGRLYSRAPAEARRRSLQSVVPGRRDGPDVDALLVLLARSEEAFLGEPTNEAIRCAWALFTTFEGLDASRRRKAFETLLLGHLAQRSRT